MPATDKRSNRCKRCGGTYTSRKHQRQCKPASRKHRTRTNSGMGRRTMGEILASSSTEPLSYRDYMLAVQRVTQEAAQ